jgi:hypothetical protein
MSSNGMVDVLCQKREGDILTSIRKDQEELQYQVTVCNKCFNRLLVEVIWTKLFRNVAAFYSII